MNNFAHWLSLFSAVMHIVIGLPELLHIGPRFLPPAWAMIFRLVPEPLWWLYPGLFVLTGLVAAIGTRKPDALRLGFRLSALCFLVWGLAGLYSWSIGGGSTMPGVAANLYIAGAGWLLGHYISIGVRGDAINERVAALGEQVFQADEVKREAEETRQANGASTSG